MLDKVGKVCLAIRHLSTSWKGSSGPWSFGSSIYNYLCNRCISPLILCVRLPLRARSRTVCVPVCQWLTAGWWFSPGPPVSSINKTDRHDLTEILLKVALNTIKPNLNKLVLSSCRLLAGSFTHSFSCSKGELNILFILHNIRGNKNLILKKWIFDKHKYKTICHAL